jgi:para-aminobenzoate synthetase/4-amino-4-deoxychorismate lyase
MLLEDGEYFLLIQHLERLQKSAAFFGFTFREDEVALTLVRIAAENSSGAFKVRLVLWKDGAVEVETSRVTISQNEVKRVALATRAVHSSDRFLFHKTTRRDFYEAQLCERPDCFDIIFWNEKGEITESSIANVVVPIDDQLFTAPVESGLLAGTFRNQLLADGKINERVITIEELPKEFFLINSVRKWIRVQSV